MTGRYDPQWVRDHYETYGDREWSRWEESPVERVKFHIHRRILEDFVAEGIRVLDVGAGAGRFTQVLAKRSNRITVCDISPKQLELNREHAVEEGFGTAVESWIEADVLALEDQFEANSFDAVVCYGGPLSYVFERSTDALAQLRRVVRPGGMILLSVMSLWGSLHQFLGGVLHVAPEVNRKILRSGDLLPEEGAGYQRCHMFRVEELRDLLESAGLTIELVSASNSLSTGRAEALAELGESDQTWEHLIEMELEACRDPGCMGMGSHLIVACRAP